MFCGECGRATNSRALSTALTPTPTPTLTSNPKPAPVAAPGDTIALDRNWLSAEFDLMPDPSPVKTNAQRAATTPEPPHASAATATPKPTATPAPTPISTQSAEPAMVPESSPSPTSAPTPPPMFSAAPIALPHANPEPRPEGVPVAPPKPDTARNEGDEREDNERTRIVSRSGLGERFVLQFSTGESVTVFGTGLLGRNPVAQPGESFDQLVVLTDPGKSVSKSHLEFGQEHGAFWVADRFSANGTVIREPELAPRRCDPGKRYRIVRGTRIDLGEQFVVVS
ncbi:FHA domain-containing protein [Glaciihabitans tibetensis]|nr:FHA domain-containing protein [Glaciihabitans tibetensis]